MTNVAQKRLKQFLARHPDGIGRREVMSNMHHYVNNAQELTDLIESTPGVIERTEHIPITRRKQIVRLKSQIRAANVDALLS